MLEAPENPGRTGRQRIHLRAGERGALHFAPEQCRRWGVSPGAEFTVEETPAGLLLRRADPALARIYAEPTTTCNLACRTCMRRSWSGPEGTMAVATYRRLVEGLRDLPTLRAVSFWGFGEPLLHPDIVEMVALAGGLGAKTELITNGLLLDGATAQGFVQAGLDRLVVSIDGTSPAAHADVRAGADLGQVQGNLALLREARRARRTSRPEIGLEFVAMRRNVSELAGLRNLAQAMDARFIVVTNLLPYTEELKDEILYSLWAAGSYPVAGSRWSSRRTASAIPSRSAETACGPRV